MAHKWAGRLHAAWGVSNTSDWKMTLHRPGNKGTSQSTWQKQKKGANAYHKRFWAPDASKLPETGCGTAPAHAPRAHRVSHSPYTQARQGWPNVSTPRGHDHSAPQSTPTTPGIPMSDPPGPSVAGSVTTDVSARGRQGRVRHALARVRGSAGRLGRSATGGHRLCSRGHRHVPQARPAPMPVALHRPPAARATPTAPGQRGSTRLPCALRTHTDPTQSPCAHAM